MGDVARVTDPRDIPWTPGAWGWAMKMRPMPSVRDG